jgi:hypothetical protein
MQLFLDAIVKSRSIDVGGDRSKGREGVMAGVIGLGRDFGIYRMRDQ